MLQATLYDELADAIHGRAPIRTIAHLLQQGVVVDKAIIALVWASERADLDEDPWTFQLQCLDEIGAALDHEAALDTCVADAARAIIQRDYWYLPDAVDLMIEVGHTALAMYEGATLIELATTHQSDLWVFAQLDRLAHSGRHSMSDVRPDGLQASVDDALLTPEGSSV